MNMVMIWLVIFCSGVADVYCNTFFFPMGSLHLRLPKPSKKPSYPLVSVPALPFNLQDLSPLTYFFTGSDFLHTYNSSPSIYFNDTFFTKRNPSGDQEDLSGWQEVQNDAEGYKKTQVKVLVFPTKPKCDEMVKELCFWEEVTYTLPENYLPVRIGEIGSKYLKTLCPGYVVSYKLLNYTNIVSIVGDTLHSLRPLDRDHASMARDPNVENSVRNLKVFCSVISPEGKSVNITKVLQLNLVDVNDNPPKAQFPERVITVEARDEAELNRKLSSISKLMFRDWDSMDVNNYSVSLLGDDLHLFSVSHKVWADDRHEHNQTVIQFKLSAKPGARIPDNGYEILVVVNDTAMDPKFGESSANLTIRFLQRGLELPMIVAENLRKNTLYPTTVTILRTAALLARVAQPRPSLNVSDCRFELVKHFAAFNVTVKGGIIYVNNVIQLRKMSSLIELEVKWYNKTSNESLSDIVTVTFVNESNPTCTNYSNNAREWGHCANQVTKNACEKTCGLGSGIHQDFKYEGHGRCQWIGGKNQDNYLTEYYATCTPERASCPDRVCDQLEQLHNWLCPQDCTTKKFPGLLLNKNTSRGIYKGIGVCSCDKVETCYCIKQTPPVSKNTSPSTPETVRTTDTTPQMPLASNTVNVSRHTGDTTGPVAASSSPFPSTCGTSCVLAIGGGALFLLATGSIFAACWRRRRVQDAARRDRKLAAAAAAQHTYTPDTAATPSDISGLPGSGQLVLSFDMNGTVYAAPKIIPVVDSKWEFPREKLRIEQTLGEGEFGRVLRAKALEIANMPGYTTVAVKTLKEGARDAELADLMSEYQLLKEVSHPNVIRLLGACTLPGGPVYLIIEFAEHGSLRNYLRRSRHLESEGRTPNSTAMMLGENEPATLPLCKITPGDILSFAWQISKGMNYLNDMKLVHRDLAARNVLLASDMVCKISDFGLTRDVYEDDTYLKRTKGRVPVKWMAPESLADHIYNSKSDVWSFGILLWELVTLGASPYPGVAVQNLFHLLRSGYRMEKPDNCSIILYKVMRMCWCEDPNERPSFRSLMMKFETMLADGIDYLDLNPRTVHNRTYFTSLSEALVTPDETDEPAGYGNLTLMQPDTVNFLSQPQNETKCAEVDKLQVLWKRPDSPKASNTRSYENEEKAQELHHYESPIKCRNKAEGLRTPTNERPQSYIDMAGNSEVQTLLRSKSKD